MKNTGLWLTFSAFCSDLSVKGNLHAKCPPLPPASLSLWVHTELTAWNSSQPEVWKCCGSLTAKDDSTRLVKDLEYWICFFSSNNWHQMQHSMVHNNGENYLAVQNQAKLPLCWPEDYEGNTELITQENLSRAFWFENPPAWQTPSFFLSSLHNEEKSFNLYAISLNRN